MTTDPQTTAWPDQERAHLAQVMRAHRFAVQYVGLYERPAECSVPASQLTWPDPDGAFPWDPRYAYPPDVQPRPGTWRA